MWYQIQVLLIDQNKLYLSGGDKIIKYIKLQKLNRFWVLEDVDGGLFVLEGFILAIGMKEACGQEGGLRYIGL